MFTFGGETHFSFYNDTYPAEKILKLIVSALFIIYRVDIHNW